jgi:hypothetical protein
VPLFAECNAPQEIEVQSTEKSYAEITGEYAYDAAVFAGNLTWSTLSFVLSVFRELSAAEIGAAL